MGAGRKFHQIAGVTQSAMFGVFALLLVAAIGGAVMALIGAMGGWLELKALGGYVAATGAGGILLGMFVMQPLLRLVSSFARASDRD